MPEKRETFSALVDKITGTIIYENDVSRMGVEVRRRAPQVGIYLVWVMVVIFATGPVEALVGQSGVLPEQSRSFSDAVLGPVWALSLLILNWQVRHAVVEGWFGWLELKLYCLGWMEGTVFKSLNRITRFMALKKNGLSGTGAALIASGQLSILADESVVRESRALDEVTVPAYFVTGDSQRKVYRVKKRIKEDDVVWPLVRLGLRESSERYRRSAGSLLIAIFTGLQLSWGFLNWCERLFQNIPLLPTDALAAYISVCAFFTALEKAVVGEYAQVVLDTQNGVRTFIAETTLDLNEPETHSGQSDSSSSDGRGRRQAWKLLLVKAAVMAWLLLVFSCTLWTGSIKQQYLRWLGYLTATLGLARLGSIPLVICLDLALNEAGCSSEKVMTFIPISGVLWLVCTIIHSVLLWRLGVGTQETRWSFEIPHI